MFGIVHEGQGRALADEDHNILVDRRKYGTKYRFDAVVHGQTAGRRCVPNAQGVVETSGHQQLAVAVAPPDVADAGRVALQHPDVVFDFVWNGRKG